MKNIQRCALVFIIGGALATMAACGASGDDPPAPPGGTSSGDDGSSGGPGSSSGAPGSSDGSTYDGGTPNDGASGADADDGSVLPPGPTVGAMSGFTKVFNDIIFDIRCGATGCYVADGALTFLATGATAKTPLPALPWSSYAIAAVATRGAQVFTIARHNVSNVSMADLVVSTGGPWSIIGSSTQSPLAASLFTDGKTVWAGQGESIGGVAKIAVSAGPSDVWTSLPPNGGATTAGHSPFVDEHGALWVLMGQQTYRMRAGETSWTAVGAPWPSTQGIGRRMTLAANGDIWVSGNSFVGRLPAGATAWTAITLPGAGQTSSVVIDGSNTAYVGLGEPHKLLKIAPGATTAVDTGFVIAAKLYCGVADIDAAGRLLFSCYASDAPSGGVAGLYRSTP